MRLETSSTHLNWRSWTSKRTKQASQLQQTAIGLALKKQEEMDTKQIKVSAPLQISTLQSDLADASRRAQQGSTAQGEASELLIEDALKSLFPVDDLTEVKKGASGLIAYLRKNLTGRAVGKINIEVKQTKIFQRLLQN